MSAFSNSPSIQLAAVILTKNAVQHIGDCIATLGFADQVVVSDSYSDDGTVEIAWAAGATVVQRPFGSSIQIRPRLSSLLKSSAT